MSKNVKITTKLNPLSLIAPLNCRGCNKLGKPLCDRCKNYNIKDRKNICPRCKKENPTGFCQNCQNKVPVFIYDLKQKLIGTLIHDYKYNSVRALATPLAELLDAILPELPQDTVIVPLPTSTKHIRERGFDHTFLIAKKLAKIRRLRVAKLIRRQENTVQVGADAETRKKQAKKAYEVDEKNVVSPETTYLLIDDVWTTGASMEAAVIKLQKAGAKKIMVALLALTSG